MTKDPLPLRRIDHVRFFVGNARQSAYFYRNAFGFDVVAYAGLETRQKHEAGYVLRQGNITFVLVSALSWRHPDSPAAHPARRRRAGHRPRSRGRALHLQRSRPPRRRSRRRRRRPSKTTSASTNAPPSAPTATPPTPSSIAIATKASSPPATSRSIPNATARTTFQTVGLKAIDHIVGNVEEGKMNEWVKFYQDVLGFQQLVHFDDKDISTEYSALMSKVVQNGTGRIKFPDQRARQGQTPLADRRVPAVLRRPRRAAHRHGHRRHRQNGPGHAAQRRLVPACAAKLLRLLAGPRRRNQGRTSTSWPSSASWSIATTKATCCKSSPSRSPTARRCSSR